MRSFFREEDEMRPVERAERGLAVTHCKAFSRNVGSCEMSVIWIVVCRDLYVCGISVTALWKEGFTFVCLIDRFSVMAFFSNAFLAGISIVSDRLAVTAICDLDLSSS